MRGEPDDDVLVVDDDPVLRFATAEVLRRGGLRVRTASTGTACLEMVAARPPDLVLLDVHLPDIEGFEVCRRIKAAPGSTTTLVLHLTSLRAAEDDRVAGLSSGADGYLVRPIGNAELLAQVLAFLRLRRAERHVRESEAQYRGLVEASPDAIWLHQDGLIVFMNPAGAALLGPAEPAAFLGRRNLDFVHPEFRSAVAERIRRMYAGETAPLMEQKLLRMDGSAVEVEIIGIPFRYRGRPAAQVVARDITERRRMETRLRGFFSVSLDMLCIASDQGYFLELNPAWERTLGWSLDELKSRPMFDYLHPEDFERSRGRRAQILSGQPSVAFENRYRHKDGSWRWLLWNATRAPEGGFVYAAARDITELKEKEQLLREQAELLDHARDAILTVDLDGLVTYWNRGAERLYGYGPDEAAGRHVAELVHGGDHASFGVARAATLSAGAWAGQLAQRARAGGEVIVDSRWTLVRTSEGQPRAILTINTDVTERRRLEQQFLRSQRLESIGTLAGGVAHDLNNVLSPVVLGAELLRKKVDDPSAARLVETIELSARRGTAIVKQLLGFARGVDGERALVEPGRLVADVDRIVRETFPRNITIAVRVQEDLPPLLGDATQLQQVLLNLCLNARDAMRQGGVLTVTASSAAGGRGEAERVVLAVEDTGEGMPPERLDRIFDPFFTTKDVGKGTGLGLSTALGIVKSHGGVIHVRSAPGEGSLFRVELPAQARGTVAHEEAPAPAAPGGHGELILVVDDEPSILAVAQEILEAAGYAVVTARDGQEAVEVFARLAGEVAAVVTDMAMPRMDGAAAVAALRRADPGVRVVMTSGHMPAGGVPGVRELLSKPYTAEQLLAAVSRSLDAGGEGSRSPSRRTR